MSLFVALPLGLTAALIVWSVARTRDRERAAVDTLRENLEAGLTEPPSLHPVIDVATCIGCGGCVEACPEQTVLGVVDGQAVLVDPTSCIGHGACRSACPSDAIRLVFGTATRGVELPVVGPDFATDVPGVYIAGELGGMGLIRNAVEQGRQAIESIRRRPGIGEGDGLDVLIVGAGPAGLAASLAARQHGLRALTLEQDALGGTIAHYPRGKVVMTRPAVLPLAGKIPFRETTKEALMRFWTGVVERHELPVRFGERVVGIRRVDGCLEVVTESDRYRTRTVLLAIGRRGTPRALGAPGEHLPKVVYRLGDAREYRGLRVLVVGGGDSALEAAIALGEQPGTRVTLSYRSNAFSRARPTNRARLEQAVAAGRVRVAFGSTVAAIAHDQVLLDTAGRSEALPNDAVIVCAGGILPTSFLKEIGIETRVHRGES